MTTPPTANPAIVSVNGNDASARGTPNSAWTAGSATTTDHIPTPPMAEINIVATSRSHASRESGAGIFAECRCRGGLHRATFTDASMTVNPCRKDVHDEPAADQKIR